jgi:hypothetical protein
MLQKLETVLKHVEESSNDINRQHEGYILILKNF